MKQTSILTRASRSSASAAAAEKMPALRAFGMQPVLHIMADIATLPKTKL